MGTLKRIGLFVFLSHVIAINGQETSETDLFKTLKTKDSILFDAAFNSCGIEVLNELFTEDFEFYHDKGGLTEGRKMFVAGIANGCGSRDLTTLQPSKRILIPESLEVYPMYKNGELYGAVQHGIHRFEFLNEKQEYQKGDIAKFTHVWILDKGNWKIKRELSYDHKLQTK